jgi:hypothetical protein
MKTVNDYLDEGKAKAGGSDYKLRILLGWSQSAISNMRRTGTISNKFAGQLAGYLAINPSKIIAASDQVAHPEHAKYWRIAVWFTAILSVGIMSNSADFSGVYAAFVFFPAIYYAHIAYLFVSDRLRNFQIPVLQWRLETVTSTHG